MDYLIHGDLLQATNENTAELWRPMDEMKMGTMQMVVFLSAVLFNILIVKFCNPITVKSATLFGLLYGASVGLGMGYGTYAVMPIPYVLALSWFVGTVFEATAGGLLVGLIHRPR